MFGESSLLHADGDGVSVGLRTFTSRLESGVEVGE
jgi:hypothetical protein